MTTTTTTTTTVVTRHERTDGLNARPLVVAGILLGTGLGGFVDGIVLHQILQWHNMLSATVPVTDIVSMKVNMFWDGLFHAFTWIVTALGVALLFRCGRRGDVPWSGRILVGAMILGWGLFNFVEGIVDHLVLGLHHVRMEGNVLAWDLGYVALGALQMLAGTLLVRRRRGRAVAGRSARPPGELVPTT